MIRLCFNTVLILLCLFLQAKDPFWKRKTQDKPAKAQDKPAWPPRGKSKATKRPAKKKTAESSDPSEDVNDSEQEVELDSLGSFFIHLIDNDHYQDDAEGSQADDVEVIILSSGSGSMPTQKICQAV